MDIHTSNVNRIIFHDSSPWKWDLKLNIELLDSNKNETNNAIIPSKFKIIIQ